jgi:FMN reductase
LINLSIPVRKYLFATHCLKESLFMADVLTIAGSPALKSRSSAVLAYVRQLVERQGLTTDAIHVRALDAEELLWAQFDGPSIIDAISRVQQARAVVVATPIYKASYAGALKSFLDLLPQDGLANKVVLPIATGGSPAHLLAIDYALKPVLSALGAHHILNGVYIQDALVKSYDEQGVILDSAIDQRLQVVLQGLVNHFAVSVAIASSIPVPAL